MNIQDVRRGHWIMIGAVVGVLLAGVKLATRDGAAFDGAKTLDAQRFVKDLGRVAGPANEPIYRDLVVFPPVGAGKNDVAGVSARQAVRGLRLQATSDGTWAYMPFVLYAAIPFTTDSRTPPPGPNYSVHDLLEARANRTKDAGESVYTYAWWATMPATIAIWGGGSFFLVGGVWPMLIGFLVGVRGKEVESDYDLGRFKGEPAPSPTVSGAATTEHLGEIETELEASLAGRAVERPEKVKTPEPPVLLSGDPETETPATKPEPEHHYRGQYYPVDLPAKHPDDPKH